MPAPPQVVARGWDGGGKRSCSSLWVWNLLFQAASSHNSYVSTYGSGIQNEVAILDFFLLFWWLLWSANASRALVICKGVIPHGLCEGASQALNPPMGEGYKGPFNSKLSPLFKSWWFIYLVISQIVFGALFCSLLLYNQSPQTQWLKLSQREAMLHRKIKFGSSEERGMNIRQAESGATLTSPASQSQIERLRIIYVTLMHYMWQASLCPSNTLIPCILFW